MYPFLSDMLAVFASATILRNIFELVMVLPDIADVSTTGSVPLISLAVSGAAGVGGVLQWFCPCSADKCILSYMPGVDVHSFVMVPAGHAKMVRPGT